jgi:multimeric flavodoxin WrbA
MIGNVAAVPGGNGRAVRRVLAVVGSPNGARSNTVAMTQDFLEMVKQCNSQVEYEVLSLGEHTVEPCHGCWACMKKGQCIRKADSLPDLMRKIQESDLLIVGSPVYEQHVSAQTKALFDRTFMWIHLVALLGKPALTAVTAGSDGIRTTRRYLSNVLTMMGCIMVGHLAAFAQQPGCFPNRELYREKHRPLARKVARMLGGATEVRPRLINYLFFLFMKFHTRRVYRTNTRRGSDYADFEHQHWIRKGWFRMSYAQALHAQKAQHARV